MTVPQRRRGKPRMRTFKGIADIVGLHQCPFCQRHLYQCHWCKGLHSFAATTMTVLKLLAQGKTNDGIADDLIMTTRAVENYVGYIFREIYCLEGNQKRVMACKWYQEHVTEGDKNAKENTRRNGHAADADGNGLRRGNTVDPNDNTPYVYPYPYAH